MSHVVVYNSSAKTVKIPTTPTKYLTEVRDEACQKFHVSKDQFTLKYSNKPISLSQQIRLANLPQGARLELVQASRSPSVISVALQLPASENNVRLTQKFANNTSLWAILRQFESGGSANYNFTQRGVPIMSGDGASGTGRLNYEMPVITVMPGHREQSTFVGLQQTLSQLGFDNGSALLRLSFRDSGRPLEEAMTEISQYFKGIEAPAPGAHAADASQETSAPDPNKAAPEATQSPPVEASKHEDAEPMAVDTRAIEAPAQPAPEPAPAAGEMQGIEHSPAAPSSAAPAAPTATSQSIGMGRNVQIYAAPTSGTPQAARRAFNEGDYVPTIEHAKIHQAALQAKTRNQRLPSDKELAEQENARLEKLKAVAEKGSSVRIRFPDQMMIQTSVSKDDTAETLYSFVEGFLEYKEPFQLRYLSPTNGRQVPIARDQKRLIQDLRFTAAELVTFVWDEAASAEARLSRKTLAKEWQDKAETLEVREPVVEENTAPAPQQTKAEGKKKSDTGGADKESKLKNILSKGLFKK